MDDPCADLETFVSASPASTGELCPYSPNGIGPPGSGVLMGDREFAGNGPLITIDVDASLSPDATRIEADILFEAAEIGGDTVITQHFYRTLYVAPAGSTVAAFSPTSSQIVAESPDGGFQWFDCTDGPIVPAADITISGGLVASVQMIGDTDGPDVSDDTNCVCDTRVDDIVFNDLNITLATPTTDPACDMDPPPTTGGSSGGDCDDPCVTDDECDSGMCVAGFCTSECVSDMPCNVPGGDGECSDGLTECNGCATECIPINSPTPETCDGLDNDCDGDVDEDLGGGDCTVVPPECGDFEVPGTVVCSGGSESCQAVHGVDYCTICGGNCGACAACVTGEDVCTPNYTCQGDTCTFNDTCPIVGPAVGCWLPSDLEMVGNCYDP